MLGAVVILTVLSAVVFCAGEGNVRLLEDEVAVALKSCSEGEDPTATQKHKRSVEGAPVDDANRQGSESSPYGLERRNSSDGSDPKFLLNATDDDYVGYGPGGGDDGGDTSSLSSAPPPPPRTAPDSQDVLAGLHRTRRSETLFNKADNDQCLSQCVFANLQVVDSRGIPREAELWSRVQSSVTSQQSRAALRDQIGACFQELQSEAEDNGCSYSNKLERCLMLRFSDRRGHTTTQA